MIYFLPLMAGDQTVTFVLIAHGYISIQQQCWAISLNSDNSQETLYIKLKR